MPANNTEGFKGNQTPKFLMLRSMFFGKFSQKSKKKRKKKSATIVYYYSLFLLLSLLLLLFFNVVDLREMINNDDDEDEVTDEIKRKDPLFVARGLKTIGKEVVTQIAYSQLGKK